MSDKSTHLAQARGRFPGNRRSRRLAFAALLSASLALTALLAATCPGPTPGRAAGGAARS